MLHSKYYGRRVRPLVAEFVGTFMFVFSHCSVGAGWASNYQGNNTHFMLACNDGFIVAVIILIIGPISGAHINCSISWSMLLNGALEAKMLPFYWIAQLSGSLAGAAMSLAINGSAGGAFQVGEDHTVWQGLICEIFFSAALHIMAIMGGLEWKYPFGAIGVGFVVISCISSGFFCIWSRNESCT